MNRYANVAGAIDAGKQPSQKQINDAVSALLQSPLIQVESEPGEGKLSEYGSRIAGDLRAVLEAYKTAGANKNGDDIVQEVIWNLRQGELHTNVDVNAEAQTSVDEAKSEAQLLASSLRSLVNAIVGHVSLESSSLLSDLASFFRLFLADTAEVVEGRAKATKESLRQTDEEVQQGERDAIGRKKDDQPIQEADTKIKFERGMDTAKGVGSKVIGVGQSATQATKEHAEKAKNELQQALDNVIRRAQDDPEYHEAISNIFSLLRKWYSKLIENAQSTTAESFVDDPTGKIPEALHQIRVFVERLSGEGSVQKIFDAFYDCVDDIRTDSELSEYIDEYLDFVERNLEDAEYLRSDASKQRSIELNKKWRDLTDDGDKGVVNRSKWRSHIDELFAELERFQSAIWSDKDVQRLSQAHAQLGKDVSESTADIMSTGIGQSSWIWTDVLNVYLPRVFNHLQGIPIPRTEYVSPEVEFVIENLDISSVKLLPGHARITTLADVDINQDSAGKDATTSVSGHTRLRLQGIQLTLKEVSFFYHDKTGSAGPDTFTGLLDVTIPERGIDADIALVLIPTSPKANPQREQKYGFFEIKYVKIDLSDKMQMSVRKTNHSILMSVFKPIVRSRFESTLEKALQEQLTFSLDFANRVAFDVHKRSQVFKDGGAPPGASYAAAIWSELGYLRSQPGPFSGWSMTGTGLVKDDERTDDAFAMGAEPQLIDGKKHGPVGTFKDPIEKTVDSSAPKSRAQGKAGEAKEQAKGVLQQGVQKAKTFKQITEETADQERRKDGWRSSAFDDLAKWA